MSKCAPNNKNNKDSCYSTESLIKISSAYNNTIKYGKHTNEYNKNKINISSTSRDYYVKTLKTKLSKMCHDDKCWLKLNFVKDLNDEEINNYTFLPEGPSQGTEWLSTLDINRVMAQYEEVYFQLPES